MWVCYLVVVARTEEDVVSSRVPLDEAHSAAVTLKLLPRYCKVLHHTVRRDFPHFNLHRHTRALWNKVDVALRCTVKILLTFSLLLQRFALKPFIRSELRNV